RTARSSVAAAGTSIPTIRAARTSPCADGRITTASSEHGGARSGASPAPAVTPMPRERATAASRPLDVEGRDEGNHGRPVERSCRSSGVWFVGGQAAPIGWCEDTPDTACLKAELQLGVNLMCTPGIRWIVGDETRRVRDEQTRRNEARDHVGGRIEKWRAAAIAAVEEDDARGNVCASGVYAKARRHALREATGDYRGAGARAVRAHHKADEVPVRVLHDETRSRRPRGAR